jgi:hypothetical protein
VHTVRVFLDSATEIQFLLNRHQASGGDDISERIRRQECQNFEQYIYISALTIDTMFNNN